MKSKLLLFLLFGFSMFVEAENAPTNLIVWAKDGTKVAYALAENPRITFTESDLIIKTKDTEVNYPLEKMDKLTYEEALPSAISNLPTDEFPFKVNGDSLLFPDLKTNTSISIYSIHGTLAFKKTVHKNGDYVLPLSNLNKGIYLVIMNSTTYKVIRK